MIAPVCRAEALRSTGGRQIVEVRGMVVRRPADEFDLGALPVALQQLEQAGLE